MATTDNKLDNPVWHSLTEVHQEYAIEYSGAKFYQPAYCPFGGFVDASQSKSTLESYAALVPNFYVVGELSVFGEQLQLKREVVCCQMVLDKPILLDISEEIVTLQAHQRAELFDLVNLVQPDYFRAKTAALGDYFGVFKAGKLVAVTGERMKMHAFTEVSAVVTHPEHVRKGYAKQLVAHTCRKIFQENKTPYLHVAETNAGAIQLYETLGFKTRKKISVWNLTAHG